MKIIHAIVDFFCSIIEAVVSPDEARDTYGVHGLHKLPEPDLWDAQ